MARNKISDLNNLLFEQLETLMDKDLKGNELKEEMERTKTVIDISKTLLESGRLILMTANVVEAIDTDRLPLLSIKEGWY